MRNFLLLKVRLTWYIFIFLFIFLVLIFVLPKQNFNTGALALFSVNSFLYGFYLSPILSSQKSRIEDMHKVARSEANAIFEMVLDLKRLPIELQDSLRGRFDVYLKTCAKQRKPAQGEKEYEELITECVNYTGRYKEQIDKLLDKLVDNQSNRTQFSMLLANKIYSHEWAIMAVLYGITTGFIITINTGHILIYQLIAGFLAAGLTMLLLILVKLSTLTHKKAHQAWNPYKRLLETSYYSVD
ncbi:MAG TPA: hypothetical protein VGS28_03105 [Candidatus Saccharimonadales bacterium]|nr:hypothetical protein [Candidatus Saccharimonadales bacterium]